MRLINSIGPIRHRMNWDFIFSVLYPLSMVCAVSVLSFSVSTLFDKLIIILMSICFVVLLIRKKNELKDKIRVLWSSGKLLYLAYFGYFLFDIITMFYTRDFSLVFRKLGFFLMYLFLFLGGLLYCQNEKRIQVMFGCYALSSLLVSLGAWILYFFSLKPFYFQRLSTARDYNVFATLIFIGIVFAAALFMNSKKGKFYQKIILFSVFLLIAMPAFYLAGSRRMVIMLPYFLIFALCYEGIRLLVSILKKNEKWVLLLQNLAMIGLCVVFYLGAELLSIPFSEYGKKKEDAYQKWLVEQMEKESPDHTGDQEIEGLTPEKTISSVLETIQDGSMSNKRGLIYAVGINELLNYSPLELIFGRGAAYDLYLYSNTNDEALLSAYQYSEANRPPKGWMSAHNFTLADILNGGIVKLSLGLFLVISIIISIVRLCRKKPQWGVAFIIPFALVFINNFISGAYGMMNDVFFMTLLSLLCASTAVLHKSYKGAFS